MLNFTKYKNLFEGKTVLVADDVEDVLFYYRSLLACTGIKLVEARSGNEALSIYRKNPDIDLIMLDIQMPNGDGIYTLGKLKEMNTKASVIAQTAQAFPTDRIKYVNLGFDDYISKPLRTEAIFKILEDRLIASEE
ncbi:MAG: response regulator [Bacteroidales bacterium]|nr:response regulator [Bacteroidales bacterium]